MDSKNKDKNPERGLKIKNVILRDFNKFRSYKLEEGLHVKNRPRENGENYVSVTGTKPLIHRYLQRVSPDIVSERLRTLNDLPKYRVFDTTVEIY